MVILQRVVHASICTTAVVRLLEGFRGSSGFALRFVDPWRPEPLRSQFYYFTRYGMPDAQLECVP
jgi:hypothetical protein